MVGSIQSRLGKAPEEGIKAPCAVATTVNITLSGHQLIGTVNTTDDMRVLVKDQTVAAENGIYLAQQGAWIRASDFNADDDVFNGVLVVESENNTLWQISYTDLVWSPGVSDINFTAFAPGGVAGVASTATADPILTLTDTGWYWGTGLAEDGSPLNRYILDTTNTDHDWYISRGVQYVAGTWELAAANISPSGIFFNNDNTQSGLVIIAADNYSRVANVGGTAIGRPEDWNAALEINGNTGDIRLNIAGASILTVDTDVTEGDRVIVRNTVRLIGTDNHVVTTRLQLDGTGGTALSNATNQGYFWIDTTSGQELKFRDDTNVDIFNIDDIAAKFGISTVAYTIEHQFDNRQLNLKGGSGVSSAAIHLYGATHATLAGDMAFRSSSADFMFWDESAGELNINTGTGGSKTQNFLLSGTQLTVGNFVFGHDQAVGAGQDNYVLTYDNASGEITLEAAAAGGSSSLTNLGETLSLTGNTFDETGWPADVQWFKIYIWDIDHSTAASRMTLRLRDTAVVTTGYDSQCIAVSSAGTRTFSNSTVNFVINSTNAVSLIRGVFEGRLLDAATDRWAVTGRFHDEDNDDTFDIYGEVDLGSNIQGIRLQTENVGNLTGGNYSVQYGT